MFSSLKDTITSLDYDKLSSERKELLNTLVAYIQEKKNKSEGINLNFICTHNSRRSHLSQIWAQALSAYFNIPNVNCYSGGTEATALYPQIAETLVAQGFEIHIIADTKNPIYAIKHGSNVSPVIGFSKTFDHSFNPTSNFAAIMTCSSADEGCPFIAGAEMRIPLTFDDPKAFDNTELKAAKYQERSLQIASELKYVFGSIV